MRFLSSFGMTCVAVYWGKKKGRRSRPFFFPTDNIPYCHSDGGTTEESHPMNIMPVQPFIRVIYKYHLLPYKLSSAQ
jgi:hypothetical protein